MGLGPPSEACSKAAVAAVIDPRRDVDVYLDLAREKGLRIAYAIVSLLGSLEAGKARDRIVALRSL